MKVTTEVEAGSAVSNSVSVETAEEGRAILERVRSAISQATYEVVETERIRPMPNQPRVHFNQERLLRLSDSIKTVGQITPGYLRRVEADAEGCDRELVDGERRWRAILMGNVPTYRAMLVEVDDEAAQYIVSVIANFNREGHTPLEIADSIRVMHENLKLSMQEIAESIGFHPVYVTKLYGLRRLVPEVRAMLDPDQDNSRKLPLKAAIDIACLPVQHQVALAQRVVRRDVSLGALRGEIVSISQKHGLPVRKRKLDPSEQRKSVERKIALLRRQAKDLKERLEDMTSSTLAGWNYGQALAYRNELVQASNNISECLRVLDRVVKQKR